MPAKGKRAVNAIGDFLSPRVGRFRRRSGIPRDRAKACGDGAHTHQEHLLVSPIEPGTRLMQGLMETLGR